MNKQELVATLKILHEQPKENKGFSFRRTLQALQQANKTRAEYEYKYQLYNAIEVKQNADQ